MFKKEIESFGKRKFLCTLYLASEANQKLFTGKKVTYTTANI